jgi:hypothetical protein
MISGHFYQPEALREIAQQLKKIQEECKQYLVEIKIL